MSDENIYSVSGVISLLVLCVILCVSGIQPVIVCVCGACLNRTELHLWYLSHK